MYQMYDGDFTVEYTEADEIIVRLYAKLLVYDVVPGLTSERDLLNAAVKMLSTYYPQPRYYSMQEVANLYNMHRGTVDYIATNNLVVGYHYIIIRDKKFLTEKGLSVIAKKYGTKEEGQAL